MAEREYKRLTWAHPRTASGVFTVARSSLWLGKDHLLCIDSSGYSETYKRFFFRDIQAITIRQTARWQITALVLGILAALFGAFLIVAISSREPVAIWILGCCTALFIIPAVVTLLSGPTCQCHIRTAVQTELLPSLGRVRRAHKTLARLRPLLAEAQGAVPAEEVPARMQTWLASNDPLAAVTPGPTRYVVDDPTAPPRILS